MGLPRPRSRPPSEQILLEVQVVTRRAINSLFGNVFGIVFDAVKADAVARVIGKPNICVLALEPSENAALSLEMDALMTGENCAVFSNSTSSSGLRVRNKAVLTATAICTAGGREGGPGQYNPQPYVDCPQFDDPLSSRPEPFVGPCTNQDLVVSDQTRELQPGVYCGGLKITGTSYVTLQAGLYVIKDGELRVDGSATLIGDGVGFYLTGDAARFSFTVGSTISLAAP